MRLHRSRVDTLEQNFEYGHVAVIAQTFDGDGAERADVARLRALLGGSTARVEAAIGAGAADVPVLPALREVLPGGVLRRGGAVAVQDRVRAWGEAPSYLALALAAGASAGGAWCGVVGLPAFGIAAAAG